MLKAQSVILWNTLSWGPKIYAMKKFVFQMQFIKIERKYFAGVGGNSISKYPPKKLLKTIFWT